MRFVKKCKDNKFLCKLYVGYKNDRFGVVFLGRNKLVRLIFIVIFGLFCGFVLLCGFCIFYSFIMI